MQSKPEIHTYTESDKTAVLNLFNLNTPQYFSSLEEEGLVYYLENEIELYYVVKIGDLIVGSGGINFENDKSTAKISWDIIHPKYQGQGLGSILLNFRLQEIQKFNQVQTVIVRTSQFTYQFYEKSGFKIGKITEDYWAPGYHLYLMKLSKPL
jgi:ribosomal protein S18 acetylase RimI-like enzyme